MNNVSVLGCGGHARSAINLLERTGYTITGIYDDAYQPESGELISGYPLLGAMNSDFETPALLAIGSNTLRAELYKRFSERILQPTLTHPEAIVERNVELGNANQILARVYINSGASIGNNIILNTGTIVEHEATIGDHCHLAVGSIICGRATIGTHCLVGAGAVVNPCVSISNHVIIGSGAVVVDDLNEPGTYVGCPARRLR